MDFTALLIHDALFPLIALDEDFIPTESTIFVWCSDRREEGECAQIVGKVISLAVTLTLGP